MERRDCIDLKWTGAGCTDIGKFRKNNEDAFVVDNRFKLYMVCDGMGGVEGGEIASRIVADDLPLLIKDAYKQCSDLNDPGFHVLFQDAVNKMNAVVYHEGKQRGFCGMGTTFVVAIIKRDRLFVAHVGDSRCYYKNNGHWSVLTKDHTSGKSMHELTRAMGSAEMVEADICVHTLGQCDAVLLCSDGLNHMLPDRTIAAVVEKTKSKDVCKSLVQNANKAGGEDNISVVYIYAQ